MSSPAAALRFRCLASVSEVSRDQWNAVVGADQPPVVRWEWLHAMETSGSAIPERGWTAHHLSLWRGETLVALAPAWLKQHSMGEYVYDFGWAQAAQSLGIEYYPKLLVGVPLSPITARRFHCLPTERAEAVRAQLVEAAVESAREAGCSSVHVIFPPEDEARALGELGLLRRQGLQYHWRNPGYRSYADFLARFDSKRRHQLKRERAAATAQGLSLRTVRSSELNPQHAELAWRFYQATAARHSWGPVQLTRAFFHLAFESLAPCIELVLAERGREVVAGAFNLHTPTHLYGRYWGCFEQLPFLHFHVCLYHSIDDAIARGLQVFEPGAGGEHKISRGFEPTLIHSAHHIFDLRLEVALRRFCEREARDVAGVVENGERLAGLKAVRPGEVPP